MSITTKGLSSAPVNFSNLVELLRSRAYHQPEQRAYIFLGDGENESGDLTYGELDRRARAIGAWLQSLDTKGKRALMLYPPGLEFIAAFFGCLYAGVIAVPAYPPRRNRPMPRILSIVADVQASVALTTTEVMADIEQRLVHATALSAMRWQATDNIAKDFALTWQSPAVSKNTLAFIQYTSGSTSTPKGVMVDHGNLLHNLTYAKFFLENDANEVGGTWLPSFHDMGLIGGILQPLYSGYPCYLMPPVAFLQRPIRWLQMISRYKITNSGGPNFAYDLCVKKITPEQRTTLDLSSWTLVYNGAEPIRQSTLDQFARTFEPCGFQWNAFKPCYGLAEATLMVSFGRRNHDAPVFCKAETEALERNRILAARDDDTGARTLVASGRFYEDYTKVVIAHPESLRQCAPDEIGEIWLQGPSVTQGYWNRPEETEQIFRAHLADTDDGPFLRTGDLGFIKDGWLYITGRLKDMVIIAGRNHYPQDLEFTAESSHPALRSGSSAAFSVDDDGVERLFVVCEVKREYYRKLNIKEVVGAIREAIAGEHELRAHEVHLIMPETIPKTSSGKIQRRACKARLLAGELELVKNQNNENDALVRSEQIAQPVSCA